MDPVTHALAGFVLSRTPLGRLSPRAGILMTLGALTPDADYALHLLGPFAFHEWHRGPSHSLLAAPILAALAVAAARLIWRGLPVPGAWAAAAIGVASHDLLDAVNPWGVQLFWPVSAQWWSAGAAESGDPWIAALLLVALAVPFISSLVSAEIGAKSGRGGATALVMLLAVAGYLGFRWDAWQRVVALLESRVYDGAAPLRTAAAPDRMHPLRWLGLAETGRGIYSVEVDLRTDFDPEEATAHHSTGREEALAASPNLRRLAPHLMWTESAMIPAGEETVIQLTDLYSGLDYDARLRGGNLQLERLRKAVALAR